VVRDLRIPPDTRLVGSSPCLIPGVHRDQTWRLTRGPSYEGFGRRPLTGRSCGFRGRRSKASQGGNRGEVGAGSAGPTYGDFGLADEALARLRALAAGRVRGGSGGDEVFCAGFCARRTQARRLERDWRACEDVGFVLRRAAGGGKERRCAADGRATSIMRCRS
jgi:hypothetical protein